MMLATGRAAGRGLRVFARGRHVQVEVSPKGVALVRMDVLGEKQNTFGPEFYEDMEKMVERVESDEAVKAVVLASGKKGSWIAGANIKQIETIKSAEDASQMVTVGQKVMDRVANMQKKKPWIAAIDGACLGGGLEMAMTCSQRIATHNSKTVLGVPEVMLGLLPGWGGTQRLPKIVGAANALDMMLTGKMLKADRARKIGLVDIVVDSNALERTAVASAEQVCGRCGHPTGNRLPPCTCARTRARTQSHARSRTHTHAVAHAHARSRTFECTSTCTAAMHSRPALADGGRDRSLSCLGRRAAHHRGVEAQTAQAGLDGLVLGEDIHRVQPPHAHAGRLDPTLGAQPSLCARRPL